MQRNCLWVFVGVKRGQDAFARCRSDGRIWLVILVGCYSDRCRVYDKLRWNQWGGDVLGR